jgi:integrase
MQKQGDRKMEQTQDTSLVTTEKADLCNKNVNLSKILKNQADSSDYVAHLSPGDVKLMCIVAAKPAKVTPKAKQDGERTAALIRLIFDATLRLSEALSVRMIDINETPSGWVVAILGKGNRPGLAALSVDTVNVLRGFAYSYHIGEADLLFPISRSTAFRSIQTAYIKAGLRLPSVLRDRVGAVHILRHSGCLARLALSGSPREVQIQLRHKSAAMTLRYQKTLTQIEGLRNQQKINVFEEVK